VLGLDNRLDAARTPQRSPRSLAAEWAAFLFWPLRPSQSPNLEYELTHRP